MQASRRPETDSVVLADIDPRVASREHRPGDRIAGKYLLLGRLGLGGMGSIWLARNEAFGSDVALKLIRADHPSPATPERLLLEARAAARIDHQSVIRIYDFGSGDDGEPFIVMEVLRGESLAEVLERRGSVPCEEAVCMVLPVASALVEAHDSGVIHCDIKPENIVLVPEEPCALRPKILDFGLARMQTEPGADDDLILGTPEYMAPEQLLGADIDGRADVWGLSVTLYELIAGVRPFTASRRSARRA